VVVLGIALMFPELRRYRLGTPGVESRASQLPPG